MNKYKYTFAVLLLLGAMLLLIQCKSPVFVETHVPDEITNTSAVLRGQVTINNDTIKIEKIGVCWSKNEKPTVNDSHLATSELDVPYIVRTISGLEEDEIYHVRAYAIGNMGIVYGAEYSFKTSSTNDFVDFRLPSGTLWSTRNIGAKRPEQSGSYLAWAEIKPKDAYSWNTYKHCNVTKGSSGNEVKLKKYINKSGYGNTTDNKKVLEERDDAATATWGQDWCIPTPEQWRELYQYTQQKEVEQNGVRGMLFTRDGKSIFLPYTGYRSDNNILDINIYGSYWTNQLDDDHPDQAKCINTGAKNDYQFGRNNNQGGRNYNQGGRNNNQGGRNNNQGGRNDKYGAKHFETSVRRCNGLPVRPVCSRKK